LRSGEEELAASWRVVVQDRGQLGWLERFAGAMPASCRAIVGNGAAAGVEAAHLVETFLNETADALIRRATADDPFFQRVHERAAVPTAAMEVRWLSALLRSGGGRFIEGGEYHERAAFVEQARAWLGQLDETQGAALRLCFILHEPDEPGEEAGSGNGEAVPGNELPGLSAEGEEVWTLTLHLQGFDGEGELIDASSLWQGGSAAAAPILGRTIARRRAALLSEIARAGEVFPAMQQLLAHAEPAELRMSTTEAWAFIRHWTPHLRENGFVVTLPDWTSLPDPEMGLRLMLSPTDDPESIFDVLEVPAPRAGGPRKGGSQIGEAIELSGGHFGLDSLMNFNWQVAVGDSRLSPGEFEKIVERNAPLVRHGGKWVHVDVEAARRAVEFVKKRAGGQMTLADAFRTAFTANKAETGLDIVGLSGTGWIERLLEQSPGETVQAIGQPGGFVGELRPYQLRGLHWLAFMDRLGLGACLADDMGLGKTIQLIALLLEERERGKKEDRTSNIQHPTSNVRREDSARVGPTLLFAPTSVVGNWLRELCSFFVSPTSAPTVTQPALTPRPSPNSPVPKPRGLLRSRSRRRRSRTSPAGAAASAASA
jgi:non-specific serine/threonine protein kinase